MLNPQRKMENTSHLNSVSSHHTSVTFQKCRTISNCSCCVRHPPLSLSRVNLKLWCQFVSAQQSHVCCAFSHDMRCCENVCCELMKVMQQDQVPLTPLFLFYLGVLRVWSDEEKWCCQPGVRDKQRETEEVIYLDPGAPSYCMSQQAQDRTGLCSEFGCTAKKYLA